MKICSTCILPDTFPGISFNSHGVCSHCDRFHGKESKLAEDKKRYEQKFLELLDSLGIYPLTANRYYSYDVLMAYSGGKDSTYTMSLLKNKYKLRILAVSFDNGFLSEQARVNIQTVTDALGIDTIFFKPQWRLLKKIFISASSHEMYSKKSLERASSICTSCIGLVKAVSLKMAIEQNIPMVGFGWSPGQAPVQSSIMKNNPSLVKMAQQAILMPLRGIAGDEIAVYFLNERHYAAETRFPYNVHPMAWEYYNEEMIFEEIKKLGWRPPDDTDTNSSNCLLNAYANDLHIKKYGFHPYVWEIANMVREGVMPRDEGYKKIYAGQPKELIKIAEEKLGA